MIAGPSLQRCCCCANFIMSTKPLAKQLLIHTSLFSSTSNTYFTEQMWLSTSCFYHRIIECFGLEGTFRGQLAQPPCSEQGHLQLDHVAQSPVQPGLECFQGWGLHHFSGQPVPVFHHPCGKKFLPSLSLKPLPLVLSQ